MLIKVTTPNCLVEPKAVRALGLSKLGQFSHHPASRSKANFILIQGINWYTDTFSIVLSTTSNPPGRPPPSPPRALPTQRGRNRRAHGDALRPEHQLSLLCKLGALKQRLMGKKKDYQTSWNGTNATSWWEFSEGPRKFGSREKTFRKKERQFLMEVRIEGLSFRTEPWAWDMVK